METEEAFQNFRPGTDRLTRRLKHHRVTRPWSQHTRASFQSTCFLDVSQCHPLSKDQVTPTLPPLIRQLGQTKRRSPEGRQSYFGCYFSTTKELEHSKLVQR